MIQRLKRYIRKTLLEASIDADGNLVGFEFSNSEDILFDYGQARRFAEDLKRKITGLQKYEFQDYFPSSGEKESYTFEQRLMNSEIFNVFIDHEIINGVSVWRMRFGQPADPGVVGDPTVTDISFDTKNIRGFEEFVKKANQNKDAWDFDAW